MTGVELGLSPLAALVVIVVMVALAASVDVTRKTVARRRLIADTQAHALDTDKDRHRPEFYDWQTEGWL